MDTTPRDTGRTRVAARPMDLFDQEGTRVPSRVTLRVAPTPRAEETFSPAASIPTLPPIFDQQLPAGAERVSDPIRARADTPGWLSAKSSSNDDAPRSGSAPFTPSAAPAGPAAPATPAAGGDEPGSSGSGKGRPPRRPSRDGERRVPFFRKLSTLIVIGLLTTAGVVAFVATVVIKPEVLRLAPHVVNIPLPTPAIEPVEFDQPTDFLAGLPRATLDYALTAYQGMTLAERFEWVGRAAEGWTLTYGDGASGQMTVTAYQHYSVDGAIAAFEKAVPPAPGADDASPGPAPSTAPATGERHDVFVGADVVGESVKTSIPAQAATETEPATPERAQIVWRNGTAVFIMVADPALIDDLFTEFEV